jgi:8-oxo-dGTP diphosphatase
MQATHTEIIVRALITSGDKLLFCENKKGNHYFLPGGHVEFNEAAKVALAREIEEELAVKGTVGDLAGILENSYKLGNDVQHEMNLIFSASLSTNKVESIEDHIAFHWVELNKLSEIKLLPENLSEIIVKWLNDKKTFFESTL